MSSIVRPKGCMARSRADAGRDSQEKREIPSGFWSIRSDSLPATRGGEPWKNGRASAW